jgi:hypothetical protein
MQHLAGGEGRPVKDHGVEQGVWAEALQQKAGRPPGSSGAWGQCGSAGPVLR